MVGTSKHTADWLPGGLHALRANGGLLLTADKRSTNKLNLDTGAVIALTQEGPHPDTVSLLGVIAGKELVMCQTGYNEFIQENLPNAGPLENASVVALLAHVTIIPDNPSPRVMNLIPSRRVGHTDKIIFGTGDQMGILTVTGDKNFITASAYQGVSVAHYLITPPPRFTGK